MDIQNIIGKVNSINFSLDLSSSFGRFVVLVVALLILSFLINFLLSHSVLGSRYRLFVGPGVILHEISHALLCVVTGAKVHSISFFDKNGGKVQHGPSKIPLLGQILISMAPLVFGAVAIYFLSFRIGLKEIDLNQFTSSNSVIAFFRETIMSLDYRNALTILSIYLVLSIGVTMTPSLQDIRNIAFSVIFIALVLYLLDRYNKFQIDYNQLHISPEIISVLATVVFLLILAFFLSMIIYIISKIIKPT